MSRVRAPKPIQTYFFTFVIYPDEFGKKINLLYNLGSVYFSPIHHGDYKGKPKTDTEIVKKIKNHQHVMVRSPKKLTGNSFIILLMQLLHNDLTGIAIHKDYIAVSDPAQMLRYFYHLDNPLKEHFDIYSIFDDVYPNFTDIVIKAFDKEIRAVVTHDIITGEIKSFSDICTYSNNLVFQEWLFKGRNGYICKNLIDERSKSYVKH